MTSSMKMSSMKNGSWRRLKRTTVTVLLSTLLLTPHVDEKRSKLVGELSGS
jgi:hypothetical protein